MTSPIRFTVVSAYGADAATTRARGLEWAAHLGLDVDLVDYAGGSTNRPADLARRPLSTWAGERALRSLVVDGPLLLLREASPFSRGGIESALLRAGTPGVYDLDDALYADDRHLPDPASLFPKRLKAERATRNARRVVVGNEVLASWASRFNRDVVMVPTCVEPDDYVVRTSHEVGEVPVIGWLGSPATEPYLLGVADALLAVHERTGALLRVVSAGDASLGPLDRILERVEWRADTWHEVLATFDIGIGPLPDDPFTRGKCAYKLLQYAAAGVPFVGSPVGANSTAIERLGGVAATTSLRWTDALVDVLMAAAAQRARMAETGLAGVREHYSFSAWAPVWSRAVLAS
jgi:glycosyltransferase involved in cell wall biosynthesis